jgi:WD40 repeat protein
MMIPLAFVLAQLTLANEPPLEVFLQTGHPGRMAGMALSGDGRYMAIGGGATGILWEIKSGRKLRTYQVSGFLQGLALSDDGSRLAAGVNKVVIIFDAVTGKELRTMSGHKDFVCGLTMSGDGQRIVSGARSGPVLMWNAQGELVQTFKGHTMTVDRSMLSGDGSLLMTVGQDYKAIVWDTATGKPLQTFSPKGFGGDIAALSHDGKRLVTSSWLDRGSRFQVWDAHSGKEIGSMVVEKPHAASASLSGDGKLLATGLRDGAVILWDTASGKRLHTITVHSGWASARLSPDGKRLFTSGDDRKILLWDTATGKLQREIPAFRHAQVNNIHLSAPGLYLLVGSEDRSAVLWNLQLGLPARTFSDGETKPTALSGDGRVVAIASGAQVSFWDASRSDKLGSLTTPGRVKNLGFNNDGKFLVTSSHEEKSALLWEVPSGKKLQTFAGHDKRLYSATISGDGRLAATGSEDRTVIVWDAASGKQIRKLPPAGRDAIEYLAFSDDGTHLAGHLGGVSSYLVVWDLETGKYTGPESMKLFRTIASVPRAAGKKDYVILWAVALSGDRKKLWSRGGDGSTLLWDMDNDKEICRLYVFNGGTEWLVVSPEGFFDGSEQGRRLVLFRTPGTLNVRDDATERRRLYRPKLLATLWRGERPTASP